MRNPYNMLPTAGRIRGSKGQRRMSPIAGVAYRCKIGLFALVALLWITVAVAPNPNMQFSVTDLPGVQTWDGVPHNDFRDEWFQTLQHSLGSLQQDGYTLLQTASDIDLGGPAAVCA